jgi:hypothetical protein
MSDSTKQLLLAGAFLIVGFIMINKLMASEKQPQFAFQVRSIGTENKIVIPRATIVIELIPLYGPTSKAPMNRGDYMLCHQFDWRDQEQVLHTGLKCGADVYAIAKFGFEEEK